MPLVSARDDLAAQLTPIELDTATGDRARLGDFWADRPAVLVHLRHFG